MAAKLKIVAQYAMDLFYQQYKTPADFFNLDDFQYHCGTAATSFYNQLYREEYARMRADGETGEVVSFSNDFLSDQFLEVKKADDELMAELKFDVMSFTYDQSNVGVQNVFVTKPTPSYELERSDIDEFWQLKYLPTTNRIFWAIDGRKLRFIDKGKCNVQEVRVIYVPSIDGTDGEVELPDGIVDTVITNAVNKIKALGKDVVIKKSIDLNPNKTTQTEINLESIKP